MSGDARASMNPEKALTAMAEMGPQLAQAKANQLYLEQYTKSLKAQLMRAAEAAGHSSAVAQEREALADDKYLAHLKGLQAATEEYETLRWRMTRCEATIEVWRSLNATNRMIDRAAA